MYCTAANAGANRSAAGVTPGSRGFLRPVRPDVHRPQACGPRRGRARMQPTPFDAFFGMGIGVSPFIDSQLIDSLKEFDTGRSRYIPIDVLEEAEKFVVKADIPGVRKEDIQVDVDDDIVKISVKEDTAEEDDNQGTSEGSFIRMERSTKFAPRSIRIPDTANTEDIKATHSNGVIIIRIPKKEEVVARKRSISIE